MKKTLNKKTIAEASFYISLMLAMFVFSNVLISSVLFIMHVSISPLQPILAILITTIFGLIILRKQGLYFIGGVFALTVLAVASSIYITSITSDDTVDAPGYHEVAVGAMRYGWNPVYEQIGNFNSSGKSPIKFQPGNYEKWDNHYPKAHWVYAANIYSLTHKIETGRSMVLLVVCILFFLTLHYSLLRFTLAMSTILAFLAAFNPISAAQIFSYYNDGMMGNFLLIAVLLLTMLLDRKYKSFSWMHYLLIVMALVLMMNLKFTGVVYAGVYCMAYLAYVITNKSYRRTLVWPLLVTGAASVLIGVLVVGLSVYPKNFVEKGSPFYPLAGGNSGVDIITANEPYLFHNMRDTQKLLISNFSATDNISESSGRDPKLKVPFTFDMNELSYLSYVDPRIAGYGVWFGGILIISITWLLYLFGRLGAKKDWKNFWFLALPFIPTAIIVLVVSEAWWARYLPQMFLVPAVALVSLMLRKHKYIANILIFAMLFNTILTLNLQIVGQKEGLIYRASEEKAVDKLLENGKYTPKLYLGNFPGLAYRYYERYGSVILLPEKLSGEDAKNSLKLAKDIIVYR